MKNLKSLRVGFNLTQEELANLSEVSSMYLSLIENNKRPLTKETATKVVTSFKNIDKEFGISVEELLASHRASFFPVELREEIYNSLLSFHIDVRRLEIIAEKYGIKESSLIPE